MCQRGDTTRSRKPIAHTAPADSWSPYIIRRPFCNHRPFGCNINTRPRPRGFGSVISHHRAEEPYATYPQFDAVGNTIGITDTSENLIAAPVYTPFGKVIRSADDLGNTLSGLGGWGGEQGYMYFPDLDLYYVRQRWYDPSTRQWLSPDPTGVAGDDTNLYRYVKNSPVSFNDPSGLEAGMLEYGPEWDALTKNPELWQNYTGRLRIQQLDALINIYRENDKFPSDAHAWHGDLEDRDPIFAALLQERSLRAELAAAPFGVRLSPEMYYNNARSDRIKYRYRGISRTAFSLAAFLAYKPRSDKDALVVYPFLVDQLQAGIREAWSAEEVKTFGGELLGRLDYKLEIMYDMGGPLALRGLRPFGRVQNRPPKLFYHGPEDYVANKDKYGMLYGGPGAQDRYWATTDEFPKSWSLSTGGSFFKNMSAKHALSAKIAEKFKRAWGFEFSWDPLSWWKGLFGQYYYRPVTTWRHRTLELGGLALKLSAIYGGGYSALHTQEFLQRWLHAKHLHNKQDK